MREVVFSLVYRRFAPFRVWRDGESLANLAVEEALTEILVTRTVFGIYDFDHVPFHDASLAIIIRTREFTKSQKRSLDLEHTVIHALRNIVLPAE